MVSLNTLPREDGFQNPPSDHTKYQLLHDAIKPHVGSFNAIMNDSTNDQIHLAIKDIGKRVAFDVRDDEPVRNKFSVWIDSVQWSRPSFNVRDKLTMERRLFPSECRERMTSYQGRMSVRFAYQVNENEVEYEMREVGLVPVMLCSNKCHLEGMSPKQMVAAREESEEMGGYFIVNGIEKLIRMLIVQRRNHPMAIERGSFTNRGALYTKYGIMLRSVRPDQSSLTNVLHYLSDGQVTFRFSWRKNEYLVPVVMILKALGPINDRQIFDGVVGADFKNSFLTDRLELMLRNYKQHKADTQFEALSFLGDKFRSAMSVPRDVTDYDAGKEFLDRVVCVHLEDNKAKQKLILFMIRKLYALVAGECASDNPDAAQHQEVLLPGLLYGNIIKEKLEDVLNIIRDTIRQAVNRQGQVNFSDPKFFTKMLMRVNTDIGRRMHHFISTGNITSSTGLDLQQVSGFTVVAEKINFHRFISHFRMIHRGSFFAELKTTTVRKLLPESWGFLCPVHTPDGSPCGLLNHLAHKCHVVTEEPANYDKDVEYALEKLGIRDLDSPVAGPSWSCVQFNGKVMGYVTHKQAKVIANTLRFWKVSTQDSAKPKVPLSLEIGYVPPSAGGQYPGLYLFTGLARMTRPVKYLPLDKEDQVGPFEQVYMDIAIAPEEIDSNIHTHVEYSPTNIFSILANMTPFSDFNQSPRNMYQCQMGKQTMGTPGTALACRSDNKLYHLQTGQTPIVKAGLYDEYGLDEFPNGTNAVVAVISYTGYDMDDAMILNKSAIERGLFHGSVYKVDKVDLGFKRRRGDPITQHFGFGDDPWPASWRKTLDEDGMPIIGTLLTAGDPMVAYFDDTLGKTKVKTYESSEPAYVQEIKLLSDDIGDEELQALTIKLRVDRRPNIGDKFSSRHGQKGVCSQKWPAIDLPFSESGIQPDVIINPHAFPSRMTIGMFVESLAGKSGALHGVAHDSTPFQFTEEQTAADYFGEQLKIAGYNYHGNEPMYSGVTGEELRVDIYIGVVFYQRLRHMVNDKFQVRSTGPVDRVTMQPVKGRKRGGGIRVGEMERDAFIGHGTAYLLQDRLLNCSDYTQAALCRDCGSMISTQTSVPRIGSAATVRCRRCATKLISHKPGAKSVWEDGQGQRFEGGDNITTVAIPNVLRYLDSELSAMGVRMRFNA